jgi:hypothetical protein
MPIHRRRRIGLIRILAATLLVVAGAACKDGNAEGKATPSATVSSRTSTPSPSPTKDEKTLASERALAAYRAWLDLDWRAINEGNYTKYEARLQNYATHEALAHTRSRILTDQVHENEWRGTPAYSPRVSKVTLDKTPTVTILDCLDMTNWEPFHKPTGKSVRPANQPLRVPLISTVSLENGRWLARTTTRDKERKSC